MSNSLKKKQKVVSQTDMMCLLNLVLLLSILSVFLNPYRWNKDGFFRIRSASNVNRYNYGALAWTDVKELRLDGLLMV
jgi:competence protein ComGF